MIIEKVPKVSVIIPNYNHAVYLTERMNSVLNQTYSDFEVIILDDCSTDNSKEIIEAYRNHDKVSHIIYNEQNSGSTFKQWHKGIQLAKGEYVWIAESDDWCEMSLVENLMKGFENNAECVLGYCQSYSVIEDNIIRFQSWHKQLYEYVDGKKFIQEYILKKNPIFNAGMAVWKRDIYNKISKDFTNYKLIGDFYFWIELSNWGDVFISGKLLNYFRTHKNNTSVHSFANGLIYTEQIPLLKTLFDLKKIGEEDYRQVMKMYYYNFRFLKKTMPLENINIVKKLFSAYSERMFDLKLYFYLKYIKASIRNFF